MYATIVEGRVASRSWEPPVLAPGECAHVEECGPEVQLGWCWSPQFGFSAPIVQQPKPEPLDLNSITIGQAEQLYALTVSVPQAAVLLDILGL